MVEPAIAAATHLFEISELSADEHHSFAVCTSTWQADVAVVVVDTVFAVQGPMWQLCQGRTLESAQLVLGCCRQVASQVFKSAVILLRTGAVVERCVVFVTVVYFRLLKVRAIHSDMKLATGPRWMTWSDSYGQSQKLPPCNAFR